MKLLTPLRALKRWFVFYRETFLDGLRFLSAVPPSDPKDEHHRSHLESDIVRRYHVLEKGLSMPEFRPGFGTPMVADLMRDLVVWKKFDYPVTEQIQAAEAVLLSYHERHLEMEFDLHGLFNGFEFSDSSTSDLGGTRSFQPVSAELGESFDMIARTRASVRSFDPDRVPDRKTILEAVGTALRAPSVCNRQTARVHTFSGEMVQQLLEFQNGNRGFGHRIPLLFVITSDLRFFTGVTERNQAWIDGGLFSMLFLLALHSKGLGAVALNWSVNNDRDRALRKAGDIPPHERIIMLIGCGYPEPDTLIPVSQRRPAEQITRFH